MKHIVHDKISLLGFGLPIVFFVAACVYAVVNLSALVENRDLASRTLTGIATIDDTLALVTAAETGQRGYLITGEEQYLEPYAAALASGAIGQHLQDLRQLTRDNPKQQERLDRLEPLITARLAFLNDTIRRKRDAGVALTPPAALPDQDQQAMDDIRRLLAEMKSEESESLQHRAETASATTRNAVLALALGALVSLSLLSLSFYVVTREVGERRRAEQAVFRLNEELELRVQQRTAQLSEANQTLQASEQRLQTTLDSMLEGFQIIGLDWRYRYVNDAVAVQGKTTKEALLGRTMMEVYPGIEHTEMFALLRRGMEEHRAHRMENEFTFPDGSKGWFELSIQPVPEGIVILSMDITERKRAELRIQHLTRLYATLSQVNQTIVRVRDRRELFQTICQVAVDYGKFGMAWIGLVDGQSGHVTPITSYGTAKERLPFEAINITRTPFKEGLMGSAVKTRQAAYSQDLLTDPAMQHWRETAVAGGYLSAAAVPFGLYGEVVGLLNLYATDVDFFTVDVQNLLKEMGLDITFALETIEREAQRQRSHEALRLSEERFSKVFRSSPTAITITRVQDGRIADGNDAWSRFFGYAREEAIGRTSMELGITNAETRQKLIDTVRTKGSIQDFEVSIRTRAGEPRDVLLSMDTLDIHGEPCALTTAIDITERKRAEDALRQSERKFSLVFEKAAFAATLSKLPAGVLVDVNEAWVKTFGYSRPEVVGKTTLELNINPDAEGRARILAQLQERGSVRDEELTLRTKSGECRVLATNIDLVEMGGQRYILNTAQDITERKRAEDQVKRQISQLMALREIDRAITGSSDLRLVLKTLLEHVLLQQAVDAASILLYNPHTLTLDYASGRGFRGKAIEHTHLPLGKGYAGRAALESQTVIVPDLKDNREFERTGMLADEDFVSYWGVPLMAKGQVKGVLEVFTRDYKPYDQAWLDFLEALAAQSAIAIESAGLFDNLRRSHIELARAYDATIEGWSRAMDLRDRETEGHTQRVTEMTLNLARLAGMSDDELAQVKRGALLHDMGKLGIPDAILLKPAKLTEEEWAIMRQHPTYAYEMLAPIAYLRPALDIPYCHHEKWDGTGYPRGLKGEQIPLAARLFAVVDVWDALRSERPYRAAWTEERVIEHIQPLAGTHFDPQAVEYFMRLIVEQ